MQSLWLAMSSLEPCARVLPSAHGTGRACLGERLRLMLGATLVSVARR